MKETRRALWVSIPYVLISFFFYHIDKLISFFGGFWFPFVAGISIMIYIGLCTLVIIAFVLSELYSIGKNFKEIHRDLFYPVIIFMTALILGFASPLKLSSEIFESKPMYKGCLEGGVSHLNLTLRKNFRFEMNSSSMGISDYSYGVWQKKGDTIFLEHDVRSSNEERESNDTLIVLGDRLNPINNVEDSTGMYHFRQFILTVKPD